MASIAEIDGAQSAPGVKQKCSLTVEHRGYATIPQEKYAMATSITTFGRKSETVRRDFVAPKTRHPAGLSDGAMPSRVAASVALVAFLALSTPPAGAAEEHHTVVPVDEVSWGPGPPTLPSGAELAVLFGSPAEDGPFVIRLKFPAGYEVPPHWHSKEEHVTVIAGAFGMGTGEALDRDAAPLLAAGSFVRIPARMPHFAWTERETVVQINGMGPFDITYVNSKDDPRTN
jgi:quercetin dioxygenase-like cupin family protein